MIYRAGQIKIYFIILSLVILASALLVLRDFIFSQLEILLVHEPSVGVTVGPGGRQTIIDLSILENNQLTFMTNHVAFFDFNHLGRIAPVDLDTSNLPIFDPVYLGNNRPFEAPQIIIPADDSAVDSNNESSP